MGIFDSCILKSSFNEMFDEEQNIKPHWKQIIENLESVQIKQLEQKQTEIDWRLEDNGVTYNIYNDPNGANRRWNLDPIPLILTQDEWDEVTKGLQQRAKVLNFLFKDLYTEQKIIKEGIIPSEIIYTHKSFITEVFNFKEDYYNMRFYAADISRGRDGKFWVINDRTQSPSGLGYAIENRLTMNSISGDLYPNIEIKKIAKFVDGFKKTIKSLVSKNSENPLITLLSPGPLNETYFEHSYLSSFLDLTLVQGEDLLTKDNQLWLKSLSGLKKVDAMIRRVDSLYCDPLELKNDSQLGVAGLLNVLRKDNLAMINPIGVGILENSGLNPFMESMCKFYLNEELILPQIATWWCGQKKELNFVLENIKDLTIKKIDRTDNIEIYFANKLSDKDLNNLIEQIKKNPHHYVGQETMDFSTAPSFYKDRIEPRNAVIRAFAYLDEKNNYEIMPSGLVRVSASKDSLVVSNQKGGTSKDLWILGKDENPYSLNILKNRDFLDSKLENISTKRAENLFWLGRYLYRAITTARMVRFNLKSMLNINRYEDDSSSKNANKMLNIALTHLTMTYPGFLSQKEVKALDEIVSVIQNGTKVGSLGFTLNMLANVNVNVKNLLTMDAWRIFERMQKEWYSYSARKNISNREHISELDKLLIYLMAYKELIDESIFKEQGLVLYDIGRKIESSQLLISKLRSLLVTKLDKILEYDILDSMLHSYESYNSYRTYYKSSITLEDTLEFLIFNSKYPKSLTYIIEELLENLKELPQQKKDSHLSSFEEPVFKIYSMLKLTNSKKLLELGEKEFVYKKLDEFLSETFSLLAQTSEELTKKYFSHYEE